MSDDRKTEHNAIHRPSFKHTYRKHEIDKNGNKKFPPTTTTFIYNITKISLHIPDSSTYTIL